MTENKHRLLSFRKAEKTSYPTPSADHPHSISTSQALEIFENTHLYAQDALSVKTTINKNRRSKTMQSIAIIGAATAAFSIGPANPKSEAYQNLNDFSKTSQNLSLQSGQKSQMTEQNKDEFYASQDAPTNEKKQKWKLIFNENFTKDAAKGSWGSECDAKKIVYTGKNDTKWRAYPKCYLDTYDKRPYRSDKVLSVHDGVLDFYLHNVDGMPAGANPSPVIDGDSQYQTYGKYSARFKVDPGLSEYHAAWLLWPKEGDDSPCAESDFPEGNLDGEIMAFAHYGCEGKQDYFKPGVEFASGWHTYTQTWAPGVRKYFLDDKLVGKSTNQVYDKPERWQLQTETKGDGKHKGHLLVDWVKVYSYNK